jgi:cupin 2 domain-containing protein
MQTANIFNDIPESLQEELFQTLLRNDHVHIERIVSNGQATAKGQWYDQAWDEWVLMLQGKAVLHYEKDDVYITLQAGDYQLIPAHTKHSVEWTLPDENTVWLAIHLH